MKETIFESNSRGALSCKCPHNATFITHFNASELKNSANGKVNLYNYLAVNMLEGMGVVDPTQKQISLLQCLLKSIYQRIKVLSKPQTLTNKA